MVNEREKVYMHPKMLREHALNLVESFPVHQVPQGNLYIPFHSPSDINPVKDSFSSFDQLRDMYVIEVLSDIEFEEIFP